MTPAATAPKGSPTTSLGTITRNVSGPDSDLIATTSVTGNTVLQLTDLQGNVAATIDPGLTEPELFDYDEFGMPMGGQASQRYGWLGGKQRSGEAMGDVILMGVRLYSPSLGRFLQTDPEDGGNATAYDYCAGDPVNCTDLDGNFGWGSIKRGLSKVAKISSYASMIPGQIGTIASVVSMISYAATGNWREAAWAAAGAFAAVVGAGAAVRGARFAVGAARALRVARAARRVRAARRAARAMRWLRRAQSARRARAARALRRGCRRFNSFAPGTPVLMADHTWRPISEIQRGDLVLAKDPVTGETSEQPVLDVIVGQGARHEVSVSVESDGGLVELTATAAHPFYVPDTGWVEAAALTSGSVLLAGGQGSDRVESVVDHGYVLDVAVYNLNVGNVHTFIVGGDEASAVVHNDNCRDIASWSGHGVDQAEERGISEDMARNAVRTGRRSRGNRPGTTKYKGRRVWVVLNNRCHVVSCGWN